MDENLTEQELSIWLKLSHPSLQRMRSNGTGPLFVKIGPRRIIYRRKDVEQWLNSHVHATTSDYLQK